MSELPFSIKAFSSRFKICIDPSLDRLNDMGETSWDDNIIALSPSQQPGEMADTVLHELMHVVFYNLYRDIITKDEEEKFTRTITTGLMTIFFQNPHLFSWWVTLVNKAYAEKEDHPS